MFHLHFFLDFLIKKQINNNNKYQLINYSEAKHIGVIFEYIPEEYVAIESFIKMLEKDQKQVSTIAFVSSKNKSYPAIPFFQSQNISFWGKSNIKHLDDFINTKFDYLLHLNFHSHILIDFVLAKSNAKCKVGKYDEKRKEFYQFMLLYEKEKKHDIFLEQIYSNLKKIKTYSF